MKFLRRLHLYLGCFFAPLLLFFVATGWYQTLNPERLKSPSEAESLAQKFRVVHTDQIFPTTHEVRQPSSPRLFQWLVAGMAVALIATTLIGVVLAFKLTRTPWPVAAALLGGALVPALFLWLGQQR